ncbi:hypothetical protein llap_15561 [Limosa lapponica baueri]|uniref:Uncharacterized protein n=1 Tax=Limosa lapponica baueri TaxID=1758121 RepID=A0A2I0TK30_LIMLA|nr:hypothetical protein llap_15561 [Limosa lapponica baueri]
MVTGSANGSSQCEGMSLKGPATSSRRQCYNVGPRSIQEAGLEAVLSANSPGTRCYILFFLLLRQFQLMSSIHGRSSSDGSPKAGHFCTMKFGLRFAFQCFQLFSIFFLTDIQIHVSIDGASQLFAIVKFLICVTVIDGNVVQDGPKAGQALENISGHSSA